MIEMKSILLLSLLAIAIWASSIPTLVLINSMLYLVEISWLRSLLGVVVFGGWVALWYALLKIISKKILFSKFSKITNKDSDNNNSKV